MGRFKLIESPEKMYSLFCDYKKHEKSNPIKVKDWVGKDAMQVDREKERPLTMEGFENYVADIPDMPLSLEQYFSNKDGDYADFFAICSRIRREIRQDQISGGMAGIYNPSITQRLNNLVERSEQKVIQEQPLFGDDEKQ